MCDRYLHCPYCSRRLVALTAVAGDNATGLYLEFFLVKPTGTEASAFAAVQTDATAVSSGAVTVAVRERALEADPVVAGVHSSEERGWDDDETPFPPE